MKKNYTKQTFKVSEKDKWLKARKIGGSSASAIVGLNPYMNALDIFCSIENSKDEKEEAKGERVEYGKLLEPLIRKNITANFAHKYAVRNPKGYEMYIRKDKPYMTATLDGTMSDRLTKEKWIIEIKTHEMGDAEDRAKWERNEIPDNYLIQCLHYLAVLNDHVGVLFVAKLKYMNYETNEPYKETIMYLKIKRKDYEKVIADLEQAETNYMENHIKKHIPPSVSLSIMEEQPNE